MALIVSFLARVAGFDRDRVFYPTVLMVVASYYVLFAVMGGSRYALGMELLLMSVFLAAAIVAFRFNLWLAAGALMLHGLFDFVHPHLVTNAGVPAWWPAFCMGYDLVAGGFLAGLLFLEARGRPAGVRASRF